ncbi:hypothetical protein [Microbacterium sp. SL75]|uniref:hypothetical protein n=1 Tax=Microbacterium sp. SL75 TaxID=2995140 RepID=UPI00226F61A7|nr:hypothetical protein [Microbacterium sp. SL75]WAC70393.1 hypothetical protein OVA17_06780 [Microbacterium sp. SL75]
MRRLENSPPLRSREQLETWVREFEDQEHCIAGRITVAPQEDSGDQDTGLVIVRLRNATASIFMGARGYDDPMWQLTITESPEELKLSAIDLTSLAAELVVAGNLCTFLQWKSLEWDRKSGQRKAAAPSSAGASSR